MNSKKKINLCIFIASVMTIAICAIACESAEKLVGGQVKNQIKNQVGAENLKNAETAYEVGKDVYAAVEAAISDMSLEDERVLGETVGVQMYASPGFGAPIKNKNLMLFMNTMANVIAQNSDRPMIPYHVAVVRSQEKNAYALPGGYIFITSSLVMSLDNEAQLAVILGHEIAHIAQKHTLNEMKKSKALGNLISAGGKLTSAAFEQDFSAFTDFVKDLGKNALQHSFSKSNEIESDVFGVKYAFDTGYDPRALLGVLDKLKDKDANVSGDHATTVDRREAFNQQLQTTFQGENLDNLVTTTGRMQKVKEWIRNSSDSDWK